MQLEGQNFESECKSKKAELVLIDQTSNLSLADAFKHKMSNAVSSSTKKQKNKLNNLSELDGSRFPGTEIREQKTEKKSPKKVQKMPEKKIPDSKRPTENSEPIHQLGSRRTS